MRLTSITILCLILLTACSGSEKEKVQPSISRQSIEMLVGETATILVSGAENIRASVTDKTVISIEQEGFEINILALTAGEASVNVMADRTPLSCKVTVVNPNEPTPDPDPIQTEILSDASTRFVSRFLTLRYSIPGTIVEVSGETTTFRSLSTGDYAKISPITAVINGESHRVVKTEILKQESVTTWTKVILDNDDIVWLVVSGL